MTTLSIDIETRSSVDITESGTVKYVECPDFTILLLSFSYGNVLTNDPVITIDLTKDTIPQHVIDDLTDPKVIKTAFNAFFERTCLAKFLGVYMPPQQWRCTMVKAATLGLPLKLDTLAKALKLDTLKESEGKALIKFFSCPNKITKKDIQERFSIPELTDRFPDVWVDFQEGYSAESIKKMIQDAHMSWLPFKKDCIKAITGKDVMVFYQPHHDPEKWEKYKHYNNTDVKVELAVLSAISWHNIPVEEQALWCVDQEINELGIRVDRTLVDSALAIYALYRERLVAGASEEVAKYGNALRRY